MVLECALWRRWWKCDKMHRTASTVHRVSGLPNERRESNKIIVWRRGTQLKGLERAGNGELKCYLCIDKAPLANEKPMVPFSESLEVYIPASGVGNIQKRDAQLAMFNDGAEVVSLSAPQLVAYNFGPNRPDPVISRIGDPRRVGSNHSGYVTKLPEEERGQRLTVIALPPSGTEVPW